MGGNSGSNKTGEDEDPRRDNEPLLDGPGDQGTGEEQKDGESKLLLQPPARDYDEN